MFNDFLNVDLNEILMEILYFHLNDQNEALNLEIEREIVWV